MEKKHSLATKRYASSLFLTVSARYAVVNITRRARVRVKRVKKEEKGEGAKRVAGGKGEKTIILKTANT